VFLAPVKNILLASLALVRNFSPLSMTPESDTFAVLEFITGFNVTADEFLTGVNNTAKF
jgi:hypothetical protein